MINLFSAWIDFIANHVHGDYGLAIIVVTVCVRLLLLPLFARQQKQTAAFQERMKVAQPEIEDVQRRMKEAATQEEKLKVQQELFQLYKTHNISPLSMGILPLLLQLPIFYGLYGAIRSSDEMANHLFLWFDLGQRDVYLAIIVGIVYVGQIMVIQHYQPPADNPMNKMINQMTKVMMPASLFIVSLMVPAALSLYFMVGGLFMIGQTILLKKILKT